MCCILEPHTIPMETQEVCKEASDLHLPVSSDPTSRAFGPAPNLQKVFLHKKKGYSDKIHPSSITMVWQEEYDLWRWTELKSNSDSHL